ncbi:MAG: molybdopterin oxidoreductase, partial [Gemmatimonadaceae bacterium]|nr:molybdopterin oxidoreductase [Gemmatimonadaceae bacterium]
LSGCRRWPEENLVPQTSDPEGRIPGLPEVYATTMELSGVGVGLLAVSYDGRPIKIEGNPMHPFSRVTERYGSADAFAQASVLELYDPDRSRGVYVREASQYRSSNLSALRETFANSLGNGAGVVVLSEGSGGPSAADMRQRFAAKFPKAKWFEYEPISPDNERVATKQVFGQALRPVLKLDHADVVVSLDADLLGAHPAHTRYAADWSKRRKSADQGQMNRVYVAESAFTITGAAADSRLPVRPSRLPGIATALAAKLGVTGIRPVGTLTADEQKFVDAAAADLKSAGAKGAVAAGSHVAPDVQAVALASNSALGAIGQSMMLLPVIDADRPTHAQGIRLVAEQLKSGQVKTLIVIGGNPAYDAPADLEMAKLIGQAKNSVHLSGYRNETSLATQWHVPRAHFLEAWGDTRAYDGTVSIAQPLIEPLFGGISTIEFLALLSGDQVTAGADIVRRAIEPLLPDADKDVAFRRALHDGLIANSATAAVVPMANAVAVKAPVEAQGWEVRFHADPSVYDGRFANNGWLQETPDPLSKLVWDNAALFSKQDAQVLGISSGDMIALTVGERSLDIVTFILPGQPVGVIGLPLGYGRAAAGNVGTGVGFDTYRLRSSAKLFEASGAMVKKLGRTYPLSTTQNHDILDRVGIQGMAERVGEKGGSGAIVRQTTLSEYRKNPRAAHPHGYHNVNLQLFDPPSKFNDPHAWGMAVDMSTCIGCNACVVA